MLNSLDYGYLIGPRIQIVDADGKPMTGAWLRVFIAGTTTDANTYSDWDGTVQPVKKILDARGETTIIAAVSGAYKIMLCDSTHPVSSPYWYADNVVLTNVNELDVVPIVVDAEVGKLTVTVVTDTLGIKHYVVGIDPAYTAEREAYADGKVADEAARAKAAEAAETERALAAEAAATTVVAAGTNVQVNSATAGDGHKTYTVSTGQNKYSLFVNAAGTSNYYAKVATCDPYDALGASYGWINGSFIATEFNGAITIFAMNVERAVNGQAYSGDMNAYFEGRNLSTFSYANTSNIEEIRLYEGATPRTVEIWVKLKTGYKNCSTAFAVLENDANDGNPRGNNPWTLVANPALVNTWPSDMTNKLSLTHTDNQVKSLAYLDTQIAPGDNITISETTDANGKHKYTITGNAPNVSVTSTDGSLDITENSTPTSKTIDLSVKSRISNFIGNFTSAELPTESGIYLQMSKSSGTLLNSSSAITVPAGTYHISLMLQANCAAYQQNVNDNGIIVYDTGVLNTFYFHTDPSSGLTQSFTIAYDRTFSASTQLQFFGKADLAGWTLSGKVCVHSLEHAGGGSNDHLVLAGPTDTTPGTLIDKLTASGMTHLYDRGTAVEINSVPTIDSTLTGTGSTASPLGLSNPSYYIKGDTIYGGSVVDNLNTLAHTNFYSCSGGATGAPSSAYSWLVLHQNSNAGTLYAVQTAYAFAAGPIIYDRVKVAGTWGAWVLRSSADDHKLLVSATDSTPGYLYDKVNTEVPIQKKVENDQLVIYQDPVQASPLSMLSTPSVDNVLSTLNVVTNGTMPLSWIAIQAHAFTVPNYYTPDITDIWNYININTQGASAEGVHFVGIYAYDLTTNTIHLVCMSVNGASHDNTATGIASLATGYVNTATGYNIIKPGLIYYAFHACDQTALTVAGNSSSTFNLSQPYPSLILYNLSNGLTVTDFVTNYGTIDLSTSTLSHQESTGKRFLAVRHAT